jgi:hypothetical protein
MNITPIGQGVVTSLALDGSARQEIYFEIQGPTGDSHSTGIRRLGGHDTAFFKTSKAKRDDWVFNWRSWTGLANEELQAVESVLRVGIPVGCLLENIRFSGIGRFSDLPPTSRIVFPQREFGGEMQQVVLTIWEKNTPCHTVGKRLAEHHNDSDLSSKFVRAAQGKRGVMGFVLTTGLVRVGDKVTVYPPVES